jgi:ABC-type transport system substrate-binding protein
MKRLCLIFAIAFPALVVAEGKSIIVSSSPKDIITMSELDPHETSNEHLSDITRNIYDTLYDIQKDGSITESLVEHCDVRSFQESIDYNVGMEIVCKIRSGVFFHDGMELVPGDVVFSILRAKNSRTVSSNFSFIKDVQAVSPDSVRFILSYNSEGVDNTAEWLLEKFKRVLARYGYIVRADYFTGGAGWALEYPVGTGPFYFKDWKLQERFKVTGHIIKEQILLESRLSHVGRGPVQVPAQHHVAVQSKGRYCLPVIQDTLQRL